MLDSYKLLTLSKDSLQNINKMQFENIIVIINPLAGKGTNRSINEIKSTLIKKGYNVIIKETSYKGHGEKIAKEIALNKSFSDDTLVIAAGGDGTYNEVANGLVKTDIPMAVLPLGTTSVLARELYIPLNLKKAINTILDGRVVEVNIGMVELPSMDTFRYFLLMAGVGYDARTVKDVNTSLKRYVGQFAYILSGIKTLFKLNPDRINVEISGKEPFTCSNIIICKSARYGGSFVITPDASLLTPLFSCFVTNGFGVVRLMKYVLSIITGQHLKLKDINYFNTNKLVITGSGHIQIDGDYIGSLPVKVSVVEKALRLVVSQDFLKKNTHKKIS